VIGQVAIPVVGFDCWKRKVGVMEEKMKERIPLKRAIELLRKDGIVLEDGQVEALLAFLYLVAEAAVDLYLSKQP